MLDFDAILAEASQLSVDDRLRLIEQLAASVPDDQTAFRRFLAFGFRRGDRLSWPTAR